MHQTIATGLTALTLVAAAAIATPSMQPSPSLAQVVPQNPSEGNPDRRVQQALDDLGLRYEIEENGDFKVGMQFENGRTQVAWINSATSELGTMEIREIVSPAHLNQGELPAELANRLLRDSASKKLGAWQTLQGDRANAVVFTARIDANASPEDLESALYAVLFTADGMEAELHNEDRF
jgi:hypothetical protein